MQSSRLLLVSPEDSTTLLTGLPIALSRSNRQTVRVKKLFLLGLAALALLSALSWTVTTYHATCAGCLAQARGREVAILGITVSKSLSIKYNPDYPDLPEDGSETFKKIFGQDCQHHFKKGGMGRSTGGMIACGTFADEIAFAPRSEAVTSLFQLFHRLPDQRLAQESYEWIDGQLPAGAAVQHALGHRRDGVEASPLSRLAQMLDLVSTEDEWRVVLSHLKGGLKGQVPLLNDVAVLKERSRSPNPRIHRTASLRLMDLDHHERWECVVVCLGDDDEVLVRQAVSLIQAEHRLELYGRMLRVREPLLYRETLLSSVSDEDIAGLLGSDDAVVAAFCEQAINASYRFHFLQPLIDSINRHFDHRRHDAANELLAGPKVFDGKTDVWAELATFDGPVEEAAEIVAKGPSSRMGNSRSHLFLNACKALAQSGKENHWEMLHATYVDSVAGGGFNPCYAAVIARAMASLNASRTEAFFLEELVSGESEISRFTCALASMGLIASPSFLEPLRKFQSSLPLVTKNASSHHAFHNQYYRKYLEYAVHRCAGIHLHEVRRGVGGKYIVMPPL